MRYGSFIYDFKAWAKVWLTFLHDKKTKKRYKLRFLRLEANRKGTPDVFRDSTALRKVSLKHLVAKMSKIRNKQRI